MTHAKPFPLRASAVALAAMAASLASAPSAQAALTLTPAGIADQFTLTSFYSDPSVTYGLLGLTTLSTGKVLGTGYARGQLSLYNDVDGQTPGSALLTVAFPGTPTAAATVGGQTYVDALNGGYYKVDPTTLALTPLVLNTAVNAGYGLWADSATGHLIASTLNNTIVDIDPATGNVHVVTSGKFVDGVSVSPNGAIVYGATGGTVQGYDIATGTNVLSVPSVHSPDGTGVISGGAFNGFIIVNNNDGTVGLIDPATGIETTIASGGTRGDLVGPDANNGTLFLAYYEQEYRLGITGGVIGGGVPEPATWAMMLVGFGGVGAMMRRRSRSAPATA